MPVVCSVLGTAMGAVKNAELGLHSALPVQLAVSSVGGAGGENSLPLSHLQLLVLA